MLFWSAPSLQETDAWPPRAIYEADQLITNSRRCRQKWLFTVTFRHGRDHWQKDVGAGMPQRHRITGFAAAAEGLSIFADEYGTERRDTREYDTA